MYSTVHYTKESRKGVIYTLVRVLVYRIFFPSFKNKRLSVQFDCTIIQLSAKKHY